MFSRSVPWVFFACCSEVKKPRNKHALDVLSRFWRVAWEGGRGEEEKKREKEGGGNEQGREVRKGRESLTEENQIVCGDCNWNCVKMCFFS